MNDNVAALFERKLTHEPIAHYGQDKYKEHIVVATDVLDNFESISEDVIRIITEHHEEPDGTGFPNKIDYKRISPLSSIFIVAHRLALYTYESGVQKENIQEIYLEISKHYAKGNFKIATAALKDYLKSQDIY